MGSFIMKQDHYLNSIAKKILQTDIFAYLYYQDVKNREELLFPKISRLNHFYKQMIFEEFEYSNLQQAYHVLSLEKKEQTIIFLNRRGFSFYFYGSLLPVCRNNCGYSFGV